MVVDYAEVLPDFGPQLVLPTKIVEGGYASESLRAVTKGKLRSGGGCRQKGGKNDGMHFGC